MNECSDMENSNYYGTQKRYVEPDDSLVFLLGPGGRAAIVTMQIPGAQSQSPPSTTPASLLSTTPLDDISAAATGASNSPMDITSQVSVASEPPPAPASASADTTFPAGETTTELPLQTSIPSTMSSEAVDPKPPVYIGIVLGTIAGVACLTALIAWWIRIRSHAKRRRLYGDTGLPWALSEGTRGSSEEARGMTQTRSNLDSIGFGSREDLAQAQAWEPRGDRDVGEPKRSERHPNDSATSSRLLSLYANNAHTHRSAAPNVPEPDNALPPVQPFRNGPYPDARYLPSYLSSINSSSSGSVDDHSTLPSLGPLRVANLLPGDRSAATSRAGTTLGMNHQTYSAGTEDIENLIKAEANTSKGPMGYRTDSSHDWKAAISRNPGTISENYKIPSTPTVSEGWTASLRSIFSVMASNLSNRNGSIKKKEDTLTAIPRKRSAVHRTVPFTDFTAEPNDADPDGNGMEACGRRSPLGKKRGPRSRQLRHDLLSRSQYGWWEASEQTPSRASSVYSTCSAVPPVNYPFDHVEPTLSRNSTHGVNPTRPEIDRGHDARDGAERGTSRPPAITRVSSTGCSTLSQMTEKEEAAQRALVDRRRWTRRSEDWMGQEANSNLK